MTNTNAPNTAYGFAFALEAALNSVGITLDGFVMNGDAHLRVFDYGSPQRGTMSGNLRANDAVVTFDAAQHLAIPSPRPHAGCVPKAELHPFQVVRTENFGFLLGPHGLTPIRRHSR